MHFVVTAEGYDDEADIYINDLPFGYSNETFSSLTDSTISDWCEWLKDYIKNSTGEEVIVESINEDVKEPKQYEYYVFERSSGGYSEPPEGGGEYHFRVEDTENILNEAEWRKFFKDFGEYKPTIYNKQEYEDYLKWTKIENEKETIAWLQSEISDIKFKIEEHDYEDSDQLKQLYRRYRECIKDIMKVKRKQIERESK